jgi:hypothetical protein
MGKWVTDILVWPLCWYTLRPPWGKTWGKTFSTVDFLPAFFTRVGTYVQRGSKFCFVVLVVVLAVADTLIRILHYCPISPCFQHIIAYSLARQPCARLPGSLARACPAALRALLSRQVSTGSAEFARAAVQTSLNRISRILHHIAPCFYERN